MTVDDDFTLTPPAQPPEYTVFSSMRGSFLCWGGINSPTREFTLRVRASLSPCAGYGISEGLRHLCILQAREQHDDVWCLAFLFESFDVVRTLGRGSYPFSGQSVSLRIIVVFIPQMFCCELQER